MIDADEEASRALLRAVCEAVGDGVAVKAILEVSERSGEEVVAMCGWCEAEPRVAFVKTSTGFSKGGATEGALRAMRKNFSRGLKMSGGVNAKSAERLLAAAGHSTGKKGKPLDAARIRIGESSLLRPVAAVAEEGAAPAPPTAVECDAAAATIAALMEREEADAIAKGKNYQALRRQANAIVGVLSKGFFSGSSEEEYHRKKEAKAIISRRKKRQQHYDENQLQKTALVRKRQAALQALLEPTESARLALDAPGLKNNSGLLEAAPAAGAAAPEEKELSLVDVGGVGERETITPKACYICKRRFTKLHEFYSMLCPECAALSYAKRLQTADMRGRVALLTGGRVKIGYEVALKLLRAGATLVVTSRFPVDCAHRLSQEADFAEWGANAHVYGIDLRNLPRVEAFCAHLAEAYPALSVVVNNACQTVRRPPTYYSHLLARETLPASELPEAVRGMLMFVPCSTLCAIAATHTSPSQVIPQLGGGRGSGMGRPGAAPRCLSGRQRQRCRGAAG